MGKRAPVRVVWSKRERDFMMHFDKSGADGHMMNSFLGGGIRAVLHIDFGEGVAMGSRRQTEKFREELRKRGLDPDTFQISVKRLKPEAEEAGES